MAADTQSPLLGLLLMGTGNQNNSWGESHNNETTLPIEDAIAGVSSIATTGGTTTLTAAQARSHTILLTGTLASHAVLEVPDTNKAYRIINNTVGGGFFTRLKCTTAATAVNIPAGGKITTVIAAGGVPYREDSCEVGRYVFDAKSATGDVLEANGAAVSRTALPELFAKFSTTYGAGDGSTTFNLPDAYTTGKFLRSRTASVTVGTAQSNQNKAHTHTGSGTTAVQSADHTHTGSGTTSTESADHTHTGSGTTAGQSVTHTHTGSGTSGTESVDHTHTGSGTTANNNVDHSHTYSGSTGTMSGNATHSHTNNAITSAATFVVPVGAGISAPNMTGATIDAANTDHQHAYSGSTSGISTNHQHTYSFTTAGRSAAHTHAYSFTTANASVDHTHTYSFTSSGKSATHTHTYSFTSAVQSASHTHTYSFTTSGGSADGTEARPESLVGILCIRY